MTHTGDTLFQLASFSLSIVWLSACLCASLGSTIVPNTWSVSFVRGPEVPLLTTRVVGQ